jgi:hypothetical protein
MDSASVDTITNVWAFLTSMGIAQLVLGFFAVIVILTIFILITKPCLKLGNNSISFGQKSNKNVSGLLHSSCIHNIDFCHIVTKTSELVTRICYIDFKECIDRQMTYVDEKMSTVKSAMLNNYARLLKTKTNCVQIIAHEDYVTYHRLVESMLHEDVKNVIKQSFVNDNFDQLSTSEFEAYINDKFEYIYQTGNEFMDIWYVSGKMLISREELRQSVLLLKPKMFQICNDLYEKAIKILEEKEERKKELQDELDNFFEKIVGVKRKLS